MFFRPNDGPNPHGRIIDGDTKIVHGESSTPTAHQNKIADRRGRVPGDRPADAVGNGNPGVGGNGKADRERTFFVHHFVDQRRVGVPPALIVLKDLALGFLFGFHGVEFFWGTETTIGLAGL